MICPRCNKKINKIRENILSSECDILDYNIITGNVECEDILSSECDILDYNIITGNVECEDILSSECDILDYNIITGNVECENILPITAQNVIIQYHSIEIMRKNY